MPFNSLTFAVFLAVVLGLHHVLPWRWGRIVLVLASYFFYGFANPWYCILLLTSTLIDFVAAQRIYDAKAEGARRRWIWASLIVNLGLLAIFKYLDFLIGNYDTVATWFGWHAFTPLHLLLPVGISFYTFQTLSYTIDVYRRELEPTRDFASFALYVAYFPQLVAGPIERAHRLLPQLQSKQPVSREDWEAGFQRILWGLVKKVVVADRLALMVDPAFAQPAQFSAPELVVASLCFVFQLYLDFSAYTDIAIGAARLMGVRLSENFNWPYLARNPNDFWRRWHMTLTSWFRDYVFRSLGGFRRRRPFRTGVVVLVTFMLMGLWHGASWHFVLFGLLSGLVLIAYDFARIIKRGPLLGEQPWSRVVGWFCGFLVVCLLMVVFRAPDPGTLILLLTRMVSGPWTWGGLYTPHLAMVAGLLALHWLRGVYMPGRDLALSAAVRGLFWAGLVALLVFGAVETRQSFIYFQF